MPLEPNPELDPIALAKQELRRTALARRRAQPAAEKEDRDAAIFQRIATWPAYRNARTLHTYVSKDDEVDTRRLIEHALASGKRVIVPRVQRQTRRLEHYVISSFADLQPGTFGILEPDPQRCRKAAPQEAALIFVPGCAFDRNGNRLGYGKGYYDRFLRSQPGLRVGLAYAFQIVPSVPVHDFDVPMDWIITEEEMIVVRRG